MNIQDFVVKHARDNNNNKYLYNAFLRSNSFQIYRFVLLVWQFIADL